jgi:hypothetical protein
MRQTGKSIQTREHHIENDHIGLIAPRAFQTDDAVRSVDDRISFPFKIVAQRF